MEFDETFFELQRKRLLTQKTRIMNYIQNDDMNDLRAESDQMSEEGDVAQSHIDQQYGIQMREREVYKLREIEHALNKIQNGSYGFCEESGDPIESGRLKSKPWARYCLAVAEDFERHRGVG